MKKYKNLNDYEVMYMVSENIEDASDLIYKKYEPIIHKLANEIYLNNKNIGIELDDLYQEGYYALFLSLKYYDINKDTLFYTYVLSNIKGKMLNLIKKNNAKKNYILNNSISLNYKYDGSKSELEEYIEGFKNYRTDDYINYLDTYKRIYDRICDYDFIDSCILMLKINGFSFNDISILLDEKLHKVRNVFYKFKKNLIV